MLKLDETDSDPAAAASFKSSSEKPEQHFLPQWFLRSEEEGIKPRTCRAGVRCLMFGYQRIKGKVSVKIRG